MTWEGHGNRTIGFTSETGVFRVSWKSFDPATPGAGAFRLTVRSAISGRELRTIADQKGEGAGSVNFTDDPRLYELLVDSSDVRWSISIDEGGSGAH